MPRSQGSPQRPHPRRIGSHALSPPPECAHSCFASSYIRQHQHPAAKWYPPPTRSKVRTYLINSCVPVLFPPGRTKSGAAQFSSMLPQFHNPCSVMPFALCLTHTPMHRILTGTTTHHTTGPALDASHTTLRLQRLSHQHCVPDVTERRCHIYK